MLRRLAPIASDARHPRCHPRCHPRFPAPVSLPPFPCPAAGYLPVILSLQPDVLAMKLRPTPPRRLIFAICSVAILCATRGVANAQSVVPDEPVVAAASPEGARAMTGFKVPDGMVVSLFAAEPDVANPVAFTLDGQGRVWVAESFRQNRGVTDNRGHDEDWLFADLAAQTVQDRVDYHKRLLGDKISEYTDRDDRIRVLVDSDGDGQADQSRVYANHFNKIEDGTGAGLLVDGDRVYYTCIPHLWMLKDTTGDGAADQRESLQYGYGVRVAFRGHDLHGLIMGPDGRLYFSIGDRGYHLQTADGKTFADPASGAVFRCETDGSHLEVFATGLRNPQELAFDNYGNLFTGDNNSDSGDRARWVFVVEGGDTGWRMYYQYLPDRGPFNREKIWHPYHEGQPAYIVPPIANFADGPSGLMHYPGVGLSESFANRFLLCDFRGGPANSGIRSFRVKPKGAFFEMADEEQPFWKILATDVELGPDGALYVSDWVNGWNGEGKGRIYKFTDPTTANDPLVREVAELLADQNFADRPATSLSPLLNHQDRRVRLRAQRTLVAKDALPTLADAATSATTEFGQFHAIWGLGQLARAGNSAATSALLDVLETGTPEIQAQTLKTLADSPAGLNAQLVSRFISTGEPRVSYYASQLAAKLKSNKTVPALLNVLRSNGDVDPILRHGAIMGLVGAASDAQLEVAATDASRFVRKGVLIAMRKRESSSVAMFLNDSEPELVVEAARALHDTKPGQEELAALAKVITRIPTSGPLARRVLNANFRLGASEHAEQLAAYAAHADAPSAMRVEALSMLQEWSKPAPRDRVLGRWSPLSPREPDAAANALRVRIANILAGPNDVRDAAIAAATQLEIREIVPTLKSLLTTKNPLQAAAALIALHALDDGEVRADAERLLNHDQPAVRVAARTVLVSRGPQVLENNLKQALAATDRKERQHAYRLLSKLEGDSALQLLRRSMSSLQAGKLSDDVQLEVIEAVEASSDKGVQRQLKQFKTQRAAQVEPAEQYHESLVGGDLARGAKIFYERTQVSCVRCHRAGGRGGDVGPILSAIGKEKDRRYLLEAIVAPNKAIAKGFKSIVIADVDGKIHSGIVREETDESYLLFDAEGAKKRILKDDVDEISDGKSPMPEDIVKHLTRREIRDLVEFLASLKTPEDPIKHE
jgi:quinoprotein glucose dehydrogenase